MNDLTQIQLRLYEMQDLSYRTFHAGLLPGLQQELIGVRVPRVRTFAKTLAGTPEAEAFLNSLPHRFYEENLLHAILLSGETDFEKALSGIEVFLPYVDNWAVCDTLSPKVFAKHPQALCSRIPLWLSSGKTYTIRFAIDMLMQFYLDGAFAPQMLRWVGEIQSDEYYVNMARAWYFATALAKQEDAALAYLLENHLDIWTHNKTIRKACESFRISPALKALLRTKKR